MAVPSDNETWLIHAGDAVIQKRATEDLDSLGPWERLVYCLWAADYGMRNAGGLDAARAVYADFQSDARLFSEDMALHLTHEAFSLPPRELEREHFDSIKFAMKSGPPRHSVQHKRDDREPAYGSCDTEASSAYRRRCRFRD
jgi:hypothetical protein